MKRVSKGSGVHIVCSTGFYYNDEPVMERLSAETIGEYIVADAKRFKHGTFFGEVFGFTAQQTTLSLTGLNFDNNTLEIKTDSKISYTESAERITEKIIAEMPLELSVICMKESHVVSRDLEIVQILQKIYKEQTGRNDEPYDMDAGTYARIAKDAVIFGGVLYGDGGCNAHSENECYSLETLAAAVKMFAKAIVEICG